MSEAKYYVAVRTQINEYHAIHKEGCPFLPNDEKRIYLGEFSSGLDAVKESRHHFNNTKCCIFCSKEETHPAELRMPVSFHQSLLCCVN